MNCYVGEWNARPIGEAIVPFIGPLHPRDFHAFVKVNGPDIWTNNPLLVDCFKAEDVIVCYFDGKKLYKKTLAEHPEYRKGELSSTLWLKWGEEWGEEWTKVVPGGTMKTTKQVLDLLTKQKFADWYNSGNFSDWITGWNTDITEAQVLKELEDMLTLCQTT